MRSICGVADEEMTGNKVTEYWDVRMIGGIGIVCLLNSIRRYGLEVEKMI